MGIGLTTPGLLVERLIVPDPHGLGTQHLRSHLGQPRVESRGAYVGMILPQIHALDEGLLVERLLFHGALIAEGPVGHRHIHRRTEILDLGITECTPDHQESIPAEILDLTLCQLNTQNDFPSRSPGSSYSGIKGIQYNQRGQRLRGVPRKRPPESPQ